jgi:hypothetical protein
MMGDSIGMDKSLRRPIVVLKSIPSKDGDSITVGAPPEPLEPKLSSSGVHRGPPAKLPSIESLSKKLTPVPSASASSSLLYPTLTLTEGDEEYKLPPLNSKFRSSSSTPLSGSASRASSPSSIDNSPHPQTTVLPSLKSLAAAGSVNLPQRPKRTLTGESDELAREVGKIELVGSVSSSPALSSVSLSSSLSTYHEPSPLLKKPFYDVVEKRNIPLEARRKHAEFIKTLLVGINEDFKRRTGFTPIVKEDDKMDVDETFGGTATVKDVEMCSA